MANEFIARNGVIALANSTISGSLSVTNSVSGSIFTGSFVGGLTGTSSYASFANSASYATLAYSASYFSGSISNAVFATSASYAATASYALNAGAGGGGTVGGQALLTQSIAATTWSFNHNLGITYPVVTVYDSTSNTVIIPQNIVPSGSNDMKIYFSSPKSGYATAVAGGGYFVTNNGTTRKLVQSTPAVTWSFVHNIGDQWPSFQVFDSNNNVVIPANIRAVDTYTAEITFAYSASGTAVATLGGGIGVGDVITIPSASSTWSIQHNLNTTYPIVTIWESGSNQIIQPDTISSVDANNILVTFTTPVKGFANVSRAGSVISGSTDWNLLINKPNVGVVYSQSTPASTWSIAHNLGTQFPLVTVYDSSNAVVIPQSIVGTDANNITITFPTTQTGTVNVSKAGNYISGSILWSNITSGPFSTTGSITRFTGSLSVTGSLTVSGSGTLNNVGPANFTGSTYISSSSGTQLLVGTNTLFASASGNVGIGTTNPFPNISYASGLHISSSANNAFLRVSSATYTGLDLFQQTDGTGSLWLRDNSPLQIGTNNTSRILITNSGNVGIGTTSPSSARADKVLSLYGSYPGITLESTGVARKWDITANYASSTAFLEFYDETASKAVMVLQAGGNIGIGTSSPNVAGFSGRCLTLESGGTIASVSAGIELNWSGSTRAIFGGYSGAVYIGSWTNENFELRSNGSVRAIITSGGYTKMSNDGTYYSSTGTYHEMVQSATATNTTIFRNKSASPYGILFDFNAASPNNTSNYFIAAGDSTANRFFVYSNGSVYNSTGTYGTISDISLKENIIDATPKLANLMQLKVRNFNMIGDETKQIGFIAQEFEEVFPSMIDTNTDKEGKTHKAIKTSVLIPVLVKAIQELTARVQELENK